MFLINSLRNSKGSAQLVAVIAAAGISSVIMLSNVQMLTTFNKQNKQVLQTNIALDLRKQVEAFMSNPDNCRTTFNNRPAHSNAGGNSGTGNSGNGGGNTGTTGNTGGNGTGQTTVRNSTTNMTIETDPVDDAFKNAAGVAVFTPGNTFDNGLLRFVGWSVNDTDTIIQDGSPTRMIVDLNLFLEDENQKRVIRTIKLEVEKFGGPNTHINTCTTASVANSEKWTRLPGGIDIYNSDMAGDVGVFNRNPLQNLDLTGNATFYDELRQVSVFNTGATVVDNNLIVVNGTMGSGRAWGTDRFGMTGNGLVSGNFTTANVNSNLRSVTSTDVDRNLTVFGQSTLGAGSGTMLSVAGPAIFNNSSALIDQLIAGDARFRNPVRTTGTTTVSVGGAPLMGAEFSVVGQSSITGALTTPSYTGNSSLCIGPNCRTDFGMKNCPTGGIWRINVDGSIDCANMTCPAGQLFIGLTATGQPDCQALPFNACAPGTEYMNSVNPGTGVFSCRAVDPQVDVTRCASPDGNGGVTSVMTAITNGNPVCTPSRISPSSSCAVGTVADGFNADGSVNCVGPSRGSPLICGGGQVAVGMNADGSPICGIAFAPGSCGAQRVARGIASDGSLVCEPVTQLVGGACPSGGVAIGLSNNGAPVCGCPPQVLTWTSGSSVCDATLPSRAPGSYGATDSSAPSTGSATFTCTTSGWNTTAASPVCATTTNGACGSASGSNSASAPTTNLCSSGNATAVSGTGPWTWGCNGINGGTSTASNACSAQSTTATTSCSAGQCCVRHPIKWGDTVGTSTYSCAEYYLAPNGTQGSSTMGAGDSRTFPSGYCFSTTGSCSGMLTVTCQADGSLTYSNASCDRGQLQ